jgi:hypothetical protein
VMLFIIDEGLVPVVNAAPCFGHHDPLQEVQEKVSKL